MHGQKDAGARYVRRKVMCPVNVAVILPLGGEPLVELHTYEPPILAPDASNKLHRAIHLPRHVHQVTHAQL